MGIHSGVQPYADREILHPMENEKAMLVIENRNERRHALEIYVVHIFVVLLTSYR